MSITFHGKINLEIISRSPLLGKCLIVVHSGYSFHQFIALDFSAINIHCYQYNALSFDLSITYCVNRFKNRGYSLLKTVLRTDAGAQPPGLTTEQ